MSVEKSEKEQDEKLVCRRPPIQLPVPEVKVVKSVVLVELPDPKVKGRLVQQFKKFHLK